MPGRRAEIFRGLVQYRHRRGTRHLRIDSKAGLGDSPRVAITGAGRLIPDIPPAAARPTMDPQRWAVLRQILCDALELPAERRADYLNEACRSDQAQRAELESLLKSAEQSDQFLDHPVADLSGVADDAASPASRIGHRIGPYEIVDSIGRGGMGEVYRARRADGLYDKDVAIKLVRSEWADSVVLERFSHERRILATLENDHIARLYDGGTTDDGIPYVVIELVEGSPIDSYCESR